MILHLRQIFLTLASTFISFSVRAERAVLIDSLRPDPQFWVPTYFARSTIQTLDRWYGVSSAVTVSPGRIRMRSIRCPAGHRIGGVPIPLKFVFFNKLSY
jgi:hypothetical protein